MASGWLSWSAVHLKAQGWLLESGDDIWVVVMVCCLPQESWMTLALCIIIPLEVTDWWGFSRGLPLHFYPMHCDSGELVCSAVEGRGFHVVFALHIEIQYVHVGLCPFLLALIQIQCCDSQAESSKTSMQVVKI